MDHIGNLTTIKKIRKFLEALPSDYQEAYHRTFDRIMKHNAGRRELALKALNWVSNTKRPLTMRELQHAIAVEDSGDVVGDEDLESPKSILSSCVGLVRLSITDQRVELIHSSARSFIQKNQARVDPDADMTICRACFVYLSKLEMTSGPSTSLENFTRRLRSLPFLEYAARFYGYHVRSVEKRCVPELRQFLEDESLRESSWQVLHFAFSPHHVFGQDIFAGLPSHASILHVASYWGFSRLLATILEDSESLSAFTQADIDARDSHGWTPLHWAASMGQVDSAKLLLLSGATVDSLDSAQWTPLFWAAIKGYRDMASLLLSRGANVHQVDSDGMTPLHWSVSAGQDSTTHLLLETIERGNVREPDSHYTLRWLENREGLSISQAKQMVAPYVTSKSLLQLSAESLNSEGFSEFMRSAQRKAEQMNFYYGLGARDVPSIEPLFRTLWRVRNKNDWYFWLSKREKDPLVTFRAKLLERAIDGEQVSLVKALLDLDGDLRQDISKKVVSDNGDYYLHKACTRRNQEIAIALIAKGADVNQPAENGRTPLHYACQEGSSGVVKAILCEDSVNVDAKDERGQTSLMTLLQSGGWRIQHHPEENLEICTALIGHGASIYELCEDGNTTATIAVRLWDPAVIKLLVDSGIRFGKTKTGGMTPLHLAAIAPVEVSGGNSYWSRGVYDEAENYQIPSAAIEKTIDLVLSLADAADMRRTCRITCQADDFNRVTHHEGYRSACYEETALALATASENWVVARRLHELGARFKTDRPLYPLLIKATQAGIPELVQLLIQNGADINPPQTKGDGKTHNDEVSICVAVRSAKDCNRHEYNRGRRSRETPNHLATGDYLSVIHVLVGVGVDITSVDGHGMNALEYAVTRAVATDILQTLLDAGSNPHTPATSGFDHFQLALLNGSPSNLSCLWEYSKIHPAPASHWLHRSHSTTDPEEQDNPVHNFVIALSEACAINARDKYGHTLLFNAALAGNQAVAQELIICGANVNDTDPLGWTPIHAAVSQSDAEITSILLKAGADINGTLTDEVPWRADQSPKQDSKTAYKAIHLTLCKPGYHWNWEVQKPPSPEVVRLLLDSGADPNEAVTPPGYNYGKSTRTPIQLLFENHGYWEHTKEKSFKEVLEIAEMLIQKGAVVGDVALDLTVEHVAQFNGHEELWETLRKGMEGAKKEVNM
jgi:ankyrin repeat protein